MVTKVSSYGKAVTYSKKRNDMNLKQDKIILHC